MERWLPTESAIKLLKSSPRGPIWATSERTCIVIIGTACPPSCKHLEKLHAKRPKKPPSRHFCFVGTPMANCWLACTASPRRRRVVGSRRLPFGSIDKTSPIPQPTSRRRGQILLVRVHCKINSILRVTSLNKPPNRSISFILGSLHYLDPFANPRKTLMGF